MTPKRRKKTDTANMLALAAAGQLDPGAVYFDYELKKWYGAQSDTELVDLTQSITSVVIDVPHPKWKITSDETMRVADRVEYAIVSGLFVNEGTLELGAGSTLIVI